MPSMILNMKKCASIIFFIILLLLISSHHLYVEGKHESGSPSYTSNDSRGGILFDSDLPHSLNVFFICLALILSTCCLFIVLAWEQLTIGEQLKNWFSNRPETESQINEREMANRRLNRQRNANLTYVHPSTGNNNSRVQVNINDTYPSPVRSNYTVRNNTLPLSLSLEDRIKLYNKAFDSNGNQLILKSKHIVSKINAKESDIEVCLDIGLDASKDNYSNNKNLIKESDTVEDASATTKMMTNGTCSICIDEFIKDDQIVYSELCSHVYHKYCMVSYLAINAQREIHGSPTLDITDNPCPSCRQPNYCQIRDEDLNTVLDTTQ